MQQVVGPQIGRRGPPVAGGEVLEELDPGTGSGAEAGDTQAGPEHVVEVLLLGPPVLALARDPQPEDIAVEPEAPLGVADHDRGVVEAQEEPVSRAGETVPAWVSLARGERDQLEEVPVGIAEVESFDAARVRVPVGKALRARGGVPHPVLPQARVGPLHVAHDDGDVLERAVVAAHVGRDLASGRGEVLGELQLLVSEAQPGDPRPHPEHALQALPRLPGDFFLRGEPEAEDVAEEADRAVEVGHREPHRFDRAHERRLSRRPKNRRSRSGKGGAGEDGAGKGEQRGERPQGRAHAQTPAPADTACVSRAPRRLLRLSPTRSALAMIVSAGFTAELETKKLPSTT